jgi:hypothetical protein
MIITGNPADVAGAYVSARAQIETLLVKDGKANRSTYPTLAGILATITPTLIAHGLVLMQETTSNEFGVGVSTTILHSSGSSIDFAPLTMQPADLKPQTVGSTISYCRRYSLISALGLVGGKEDDDGAVGTYGSTVKQPAVTGDYHDDTLWEPTSNSPKQPDTVSIDQMNRITTLGEKVYADNFGAQSQKLAEWASGGARKTLAALKVIEGEKLIRSLEKKLAPAVNGKVAV